MRRIRWPDGDCQDSLLWPSMPLVLFFLEKLIFVSSHRDGNWKCSPSGHWAASTAWVYSCSRAWIITWPPSRGSQDESGVGNSAISFLPESEAQGSTYPPHPHTPTNFSSLQPGDWALQDSLEAGAPITLSRPVTNPVGFIKRMKMKSSMDLWGWLCKVAMAPFHS